MFEVGFGVFGYWVWVLFCDFECFCGFSECVVWPFLRVVLGLRVLWCSRGFGLCVFIDFGDLGLFCLWVCVPVYMGVFGCGFLGFPFGVWVCLRDSGGLGLGLF